MDDQFDDSDDDNQMVPVVVASPEEHFRSLLETSREIVLHELLQSSHAETDDYGGFSELQEDLLDAVRRTERLVKAGIVLPSEVQEAHMILALAQLLPGATLQSVMTSLHTCLDVKTTARGSLMELVLDSDYNFAQLFTSGNNNEEAILQLETHLIAAQPTSNNNSTTQALQSGRPTKRRRLRHKLHTETDRAISYWKVSLAYVLCQLAYDSLTLLPYPFSVEELLDRTQNLARPFGLRTSDLLCAAHAFFLLDLYVGVQQQEAQTVRAPVRRMPEGLTLERVVHELTARRYVELSVYLLCYAMVDCLCKPITYRRHTISFLFRNYLLQLHCTLHFGRSDQAFTLCRFSALRRQAVGPRKS
jgi:hypothetical protein